jgi:hypothetical protein
MEMGKPTGQIEAQIIGQPPELAGLQCAGVLCQAFVCDGRLIESANVIYLKFADAWHRLNIDAGVIFWKRSDGAPSSWAIEKKGWEYPLVDVGGSAGVVGELLDHYEMSRTSTGGRVVFVFANGRRIIIDSVGDRSSYHVP